MATLPDAVPQRTDQPASDSKSQIFYSISQSAALLGVSRVTIWRWIRAGHLPVARLGHRTTRIKLSDLEHLPLQIGPAGFRSRRVDDSAPTPVRPVASVQSEPVDGEHYVQFYESDEFLLESVGEFVAGALHAGDAAIVVGTADHRARLEAALLRDGHDLQALRSANQFVALDAAECLGRFMREGTADKTLFAELIGPLIQRASEGQRRVRIYGEMVALLAADGQHAATIGLEQLWNDLQQSYPFSLLCGYPMDRFGGEALAELLGNVCAAHSRVVPTESYTALTDADERMRVIIALQQQAQSLEAEVAERKRVEDELRVALAAIQAALRSRDEFLATASHELRTPLTALSGQAQLALRRIGREGPEPKRFEHSLRTIATQADKLARLVNELLDISRLESGKLQLNCQPTDLAALVEESVCVARDLSDHHVITFDPQVTVTAQVDQLRLEQVINNLLDNAIKYSPQGGEIAVTLTEPRPGEVELSVRDHGLGIRPEKRPQIFERYYQAHGDGFRSGMGLGLYITREIVELHGGAIQAEFPEDGGSRFIVRLPVA
jgi:excisionase family DNA binding protein